MLQGWIEVGLSNPNVFLNQNNNDVIIRTHGNGNKLIFGNTSNLAPSNVLGSMYISGNNVGYKKVPDVDIDVDINGIIASTHAKIASNMYIGYSNTPGYLELNGDLSFINNNTSPLLIQNSNNSISFIYSNVERVKLTNGSGIYLNDNVNVSFDVFAQGFHMTSDRKLKDNIKTSSIYDDLNTLLKLSVCDFNFKGQSNTIKGLIAQEVDDIFPQAITQIEKIVYDCKGWGTLRKNIFEYHDIEQNNISTLRVGDNIMFGFNENIRSCIATIVSFSNNYIVLDNNYNGKVIGNELIGLDTNNEDLHLFVHGKIEVTKTIDTTQLIALCISAIQALHKQYN
jgi:hypothetical protein